MMTKVHPAVGVGVGVIGGMVIWAYSHLGAAFFALLGLIFLNLIAALWERDLIQSVHKWIRVIAGVALPAVVPLFAHDTSVVWTDHNTHVLIAAVFAALLSATVPDLLTFANKALSYFGASGKTKTEIIAELQAELEKAKAGAAAAPGTVPAQVPGENAGANPPGAQ